LKAVIVFFVFIITLAAGRAASSHTETALEKQLYNVTMTIESLVLQRKNGEGAFVS